MCLLFVDQQHSLGLGLGGQCVFSLPATQFRVGGLGGEAMCLLFVDQQHSLGLRSFGFLGGGVGGVRVSGWGGPCVFSSLT